ncbi:MAG: aminopeptidase [Planctomycetes bacterium]|nr:aminopeptidase [Planctomycetota bacterium]
MHDSRLEKLADVLVNYSVAVQKGDLVAIQANTAADPLVMCVYRAVLKAGGRPWVRCVPEEVVEALLKHGSDEQIRRTSELDRHVMSTVNARISFWADQNTRALSNVNPKKQALLSQGRKPIMDVFFKRAAKPASDPDRLRWVGTAYPTLGMAQDAEMSLNEYADFVFTAGKLDQKNPAAAWRKLGESQKRLADFLSKARELRFTAPNGTDLRVGVKGRRWINCDGHENFPDGEVFTGPIEDATEGTVCYSFPAIHDGIEVADVRLVFKAGRVVDCSASKNEAFLIQMLDQDRGARCFGEIAVGTNYQIQKFTKNTLFDEKIGGTFHAAVGAAYPESGGKNKSGLHWDMVCDLRQGGVIEADGKAFSRNGKFLNASWPR